MNVRSRLAAIVVALALTFSVTSMAVAQEVPVSVEVTGATAATFEWTIAQSIPFRPLQYSFADQTTNGAITVTISDTRGTKAGWSLYVSGTNFVGQSTGDIIPIGNLSLTSGAVQVLEGQSSPLPTASSISAVSSSSQLLVSAANGSGAGRYSVQITGSVLVPGGTLVDTYTSTITVSQTAAP